MPRFNSVFSLSNIAATFTDGHTYPASTWVVNGVTPTNYMMCYRTIDAAIEFAGVDVDSNFGANYTPKQIQNMCEKYFSQVTGDNVESYESEARKEIWKHFTKTGNALRAVIKDVNCELTIYLYNYHQAVFMIKNGKKLEV